jgi:hypothetical protein
VGRRQALPARQEGAAAGQVEDALGSARAQLAAGRYFEGHDTLEGVWMTAQGELKTALQGLVQICAGLHKHARGEQGGARYLLGRGLAKIRAHGAALPEGAAGPFEKAALRAFASLSEGA